MCSISYILLLVRHILLQLMMRNKDVMKNIYFMKAIFFSTLSNLIRET